MKYIQKMQAWIGARLWRRLMASYLTIVLGGFFLLQFAVSLLILQNKNANKYPESLDAGVVAYAYAHTTNQLMESDQLEYLPILMDQSLRGNIGFTYPLFEDSPIHLQRNPNELPENWMEHIECIQITDSNHNILSQTGACKHQSSDVSNHLRTLSQFGESNPMVLNAVNNSDAQRSYIGIAKIVGKDDEDKGLVYVEMSPHEQKNPSELLIDNFAIFSFLILLSSFVLGIPALIIAFGLSTFSGWITSKELVNRLKELERSAQSLASGDLSIQITDTTADEIGQVGQAFNRMAQQLSSNLTALSTEKNRVENLLKAKKELTATISHDLRTPVATISLYLETLQEKPQHLEKYLPILRFETEQLSKRIDDLFELSRIDAQELTLHPTAVDINSLLTKIIGNYQHLAWKQYGVVLEYEPNNGLQEVYADVQRVEQIMANLIMNSLRFTPRDGCIHIEVEKISETFLEIRVKDNGTGISIEDLPYIFDRFFHKENDIEKIRLPKGSGLGLTITKALVEAMNGEISASSTPGEGTCIRFTLPIFNIRHY